MAGTVVGSVDHRSAATGFSSLMIQELFVMLYNFFNTTMVGGGKCTRIASQFGSGGTGFDFHDGGSPSGDNAFAVFEFPTSGARAGGGSALGLYNVLIQYSEAGTFGSAPGNPGLSDDSTGRGVAITAAFREDGTRPWAGGVANAGADSKGATVWTPGGSTVHVLDRNCSPGPPAGNRNTNKENMNEINDPAGFAGPFRFHAVGDDDSFALFIDNSDTNLYKFGYYGLWLPPTGITAAYPMVGMQLDSNLMFSNLSIWGDTNSSGVEQGVLVNPNDEDVQYIVASDLDGVTNSSASFQPNPFRSPAAMDEVGIRLQSNEQTFGHCGIVDPAMLAIVASSPGISEDTNAALSRAYLSGSGSSLALSIPWGGGAAPGTNNTRAGVQF